MPPVWSRVDVDADKYTKTCTVERTHTVEYSTSSGELRATCPNDDLGMEIVFVHDDECCNLVDFTNNPDFENDPNIAACCKDEVIEEGDLEWILADHTCRR